MKRFLRFGGIDACQRMLQMFNAAKEVEAAGLSEADEYLRELSNLWAFITRVEIEQRKVVRS